MPKIEDLKIKIFADGADLKSIENLNSKNFIKGFTTNPTLMRKSGINDYKKFATEVKNVMIVNNEINQPCVDKIKVNISDIYNKNKNSFDLLNF